MPEFPEFPGEALSKSEYKKRLKLLSKERKQQEKMPSSSQPPTHDADEDAPDAYRQSRIDYVEKCRANGDEPFPHKFHTDLSISEFKQRFCGYSTAFADEDVTVSIAGRVSLRRTSGSKLVFYSVTNNGESLQVMADKSSASNYDFEYIRDNAKRGDIVGVRGHPGRSKRGELSLFPTEFTILSPCMHLLPKGPSALSDQEVRYRNRYLDLIVHEGVRDVFCKRNRMMKYIREFLDSRNFMEVETPMMNTIPGGAAARPFVTHHNELDMQLYMRIAPELYLKQLVVGGLERVYEIGRQFRNEGIDLTHNPEFTTVECYEAYADYYDIMQRVEEMLSGLVLAVNGSYLLRYHPEGKDGREIEIDFTPPFRRLPMLDGIAEKGVELPKEYDLESEEMSEWLRYAQFTHIFFHASFLLYGFHPTIDLSNRRAKTDELDLEVEEPQTTSRLIDALVEHLLEGECTNPTFIMDHPQLMSPLAKYHRSKPRLTERFELYVNGKELANAFTEMNDPLAQRNQFEEQAAQKSQGDDEAQVIDETFCEALEHGLPPTGGWGLGIDRLAMLITDCSNIKEVLLFPAMKPQGHQHH